MISNQEKKKKKKARLLHHIGELHSHSRIRLPKKWNFCLLINKWASQTSAASCGCPVHDSLLGNAVKFSIWDAVLGTRIWVGVLCAFGSQDITLANSLGSFFSSLFFLLLESNCFIILCWPLSLYHFFKVDRKMKEVGDACCRRQQRIFHHEDVWFSSSSSEEETGQWGDLGECSFWWRQLRARAWK